ncbi:hypothetical protein [Fluctibacter halophilus]|nr:hypothetical protein [Aestuariibacter halophilus]
MHAQPKPQRMAISVVDDHSVRLLFCPIVRDAYVQLGIEPEFVVMVSGRALVESARGNLDAELVRSEVTGQAQAELVKVPTSLGVVRGRLYCRVGLPCSLRVLANRNTQVGLITGDNAMSRFLSQQAARAVWVPTVDALQGMFKRKRIDYALGLEHATGFHTGPLEDVRVAPTPWYEGEVFHYVHQRHRELIEPLSAALAHSIDTVGFVRNGPEGVLDLCQ